MGEVVDFDMFRPKDGLASRSLIKAPYVFLKKINLKHLEMQVFSTTQPDLPMGGWMDGLGDGFLFPNFYGFNW